MTEWMNERWRRRNPITRLTRSRKNAKTKEQWKACFDAGTATWRDLEKSGLFTSEEIEAFRRQALRRIAEILRE